MMHTKTCLEEYRTRRLVIKFTNQFDPFTKMSEGIQEEIGLFASGR